MPPYIRPVLQLPLPRFKPLFAAPPEHLFGVPGPFMLDEIFDLGLTEIGSDSLPRQPIKHLVPLRAPVWIHDAVIAVDGLDMGDFLS
jgi:hypothetical protein